MFNRNNNSGLPSFGGNRKDNGVNIPVVNKNVLFSVIWLVASIFSIIFGIFHCGYFSHRVKIKCDLTDCSIYAKINDDYSTINFPRRDFLQAIPIRIDHQGNLIEVEKMKKKRSHIYGHSVHLKLRLPTQEINNMKLEQFIVFSPHNMGRVQARKKSMVIQDYIEKDTDAINITHGSSITTIGILMIFLGFVSSIAACLFGQFADRPKRSKKSS
eukprot:gene6335-8722_t